MIHFLALIASPIKLSKRLFLFVRLLGWRHGWMYWCISNHCERSPEVVLNWADNCEIEALRLQSEDDLRAAKIMRLWASELRRCHDSYLGLVTPTKISSSNELTLRSH